MKISFLFSVAAFTVFGENEESVDVDGDEDEDNCWLTSVGKFRFSLDALPQHLQLIHQLLLVNTLTISRDGLERRAQLLLHFLQEIF